jgi:hypothetical protein
VNFTSLEVILIEEGFNVEGKGHTIGTFMK